MNSPWGLAVAFTWGFTEALSWPVMAEMALAFLAVAVHRRIFIWAGAVVVGSVLGVLSNAWLAAQDILVPTPWTTEQMFSTAQEHMSGGSGGIVNQALNGIPVKVYAQVSGQLGIDLGELAAWTLVERGLRMAAAALVFFVLALLLQRLLRRWYATYLLLAMVGFSGGLTLVISTWR